MKGNFEDNKRVIRSGRLKDRQCKWPKVKWQQDKQLNTKHYL